MKLYDHGTVTPYFMDGVIMRIVFRGEGKARFRLQHTRDDKGKPLEIGWCDASGMSDPRVKDYRTLLEGHPNFLTKRGIGGLKPEAIELVGNVDGNVEVLYRRHLADWLRVIPFEAEYNDACSNYEVTIEETSADR